MLLASNSSDEQKEQFYRRAQMLTAMNGTPQSAPPLTIGESRLLNEYQSTPDQKPYGLNHYSNVGPARARGLETPMGLIVSRQSASSSGNSGGLPTTRLPARPPGGDARDFEARMATALRANVFAQRAAQAMSTGQNIYIPSSGSENIYEEISDASLYGYPVARNYWPGLSSSPSSRPSAIPQQTPSARYLSPHHVHHPMTSPQSQSRSLLWGTQTPQEFHRRVLGELNLEVEAMIMPHDPPPPSALDPSTPTSPNDRKTSLSSPGRPKHSKQMSCPEDTVRESRYDVPRIPPAPFSPLLCRQRSLDNSELRRAGSLSQVSATLSELKHLAPRYANGGFLARRRQWIRERGKNGGHVHQLSQDSDASSTVTWDASSTTSLLRSHRRRPHAHPHPHSASSTLSGRSSSCEPEYALYDAGYRDPWVSSAGDPGPRKEPPESRNTTNNAADCGTASHPETGKSPQVAQLPTCEDLEQSDPPSPAKQNGGSGTTLADGGTSSDDGADTGALERQTAHVVRRNRQRHSHGNVEYRFSSCEEPFLYQNGGGGETLNGTAQASSRFTRWFSWRRDGTLIGGSTRESRRRQEEGSDGSGSTDPFYPLGTPRRQQPPSLPPQPADLTSNQLRRRMIVASIVQTENNYVAALQTLRDYKRCLEESSPPILGVGKVHSLFYRIPEILQIHSLFRVALSERVRLWDQEEAIGDVFVASFTKGIVLDIYSEFINNFSTAMDLARSESKRKSSFADFLHAKQLVHSDRLSLFGLLVKPVQRFPQFILQLQDLLSATPHGHPDRLSLQLALSTLEVLADDLNERKREAEKGLALKETLRKINGRKLSGLLTTRSLSVEGGRSLIRSDDVTQLEFNSAGLISKMKRRRLLLTTDLVVCVSLPSEENGRVSLKWATSVGEIQVPFSGGTSLARTLPNHERIYATKEEVQESGGANATRKKVGSTSSLNAVSKGLSRSSPTSTYAGDSSCGNITDLIHDYEILKRVSGQLASLKGHYEALPVGEIEAVISDIQRTLRSRDSEVAWVDASCILIPVKNNKPPVSLQMASPQAKADWLRDLRLAQLATSENNSPAWDIPEAEKSRPLSRLPLFLDTVSCWDSPRPSEVTCGCVFIPRTSSPERGCDHPSAHARNLLPPSAPASSSSSSSLDPPASKRRAGGPSVWMASSDGVTSRLSAYRHVDGSSKALNPEFSLDLVGIVATAMEFVTGDDPSDPRDTVWIGTKCPSLLIYSATLSPMSPSPQPDTTLPLPSTPLAIAFVSSSSPRVFVALSSGSIAVISPSDPSLPSSTIHLRPSGPPTPVSALLPCPPFLYAACGDGVWVVDGENQQVLQNFQVEHDHESSSISLLAQSGIGLWLAMEGSGTVCLYHTETFKHLQDIDVRKSVSRFHPAQWSGQLHRPTPLAVTALRTGRGLLWVGTSIGAVLTIPLPRLEGLPIISSGRANVAVHMHQGPVHVILPVSFPMTPSPCDVGRSCLPPLSPPSSRSSSRSSSVDDLALDETSSGGAGENLLDVSSSQGSTVDHQPQPQGQHHPRHPQLRRRGSMSVTPGSAASMKPARKRPSQTLPRGFGGNVSPSFQEPEYDVYGLYEELLKDSCLNASPSTSSTGITKPASSDQSVKSYTKAHHYLKPPATKKPPGSSNASQPHTVLTITGGGGYVRRLPSGGTSTATGTRDSGFGGSNTSILNNVLTETSRHSTLMLWIAKP